MGHRAGQADIVSNRQVHGHVFCSECTAPFGQPAAVQIGFPADLSIPTSKRAVAAAALLRSFGLHYLHRDFNWTKTGKRYVKGYQGSMAAMTKTQIARIWPNVLIRPSVLVEENRTKYPMTS
jgi:hypothetical protein